MTMTADEWKKVQVGTSVRVKRDGAYVNTTTKRSPYYVQGQLWVRCVGMSVAVPVRDVEVVPQPAAEPAAAGYSYGIMGAGP